MPTVDPRYMVMFTASNGLTLSVMAAETSSALTQGFGGWEEVERPKRVSMTRFKGKPLFKQDVPVLFDGWPDGGNQEVAISKLIRMSQQAGVNAPPPTIRISGPVQRKDLTWVIENITWDTENVIREMVHGASVRMRQGATVHLMQYVDDKVLVTPAKPKVATKVVDAKGKTPKQLSQEMYGSPDFWQMFQDATGKIFNPRKPIPKGTKVVVPPKKTSKPGGSARSGPNIGPGGGL